MALEDIKLTEDEVQELNLAAGLLGVQIELFSGLEAGNDEGNFDVKDDSPNKADATVLADILFNFIVECKKEVSVNKGTSFQRIYSTDPPWDENFVLHLDTPGERTKAVKIWKDKMVPFLESLVTSLDGMPPAVSSKKTIFLPDGVGPNSPWKTKKDIPGLNGKNLLRESLFDFINNIKRFLNAFGKTYFLRRRIAPPPGVTSVGENIPTDIVLQQALGLVGGDTATPVEATHYIAFLEPAKYSKTESQPFLPIRLAPYEYPTPLAAGWDDLGYKFLNSKNKLVDPDPAKHPHAGVYMKIGTLIRVTEVVLGRSGIWVGFVETSADWFGAPFAKHTNNYQRILYTRPEYLRKLVRDKAPGGDIQIDPVLSYSLMAYNNEKPRATVPDGIKLIKPGENLNWKRLLYGDVQLAYFNFNEYNKNNNPQQQKDKPPVLTHDQLIINPRLRFSEGYYYFVVMDTSRKTVGQLLSEMSPTSNTSQALEELKAEQRIQMIANLRVKALNMILEYTGKVTDIQSEKHEALHKLYTAHIAQSTSVGGASNMKVLFACPAQIIDALPDNPNPYYDNIISTSDFYGEFSSGRDYTFTVKVSDVKKIAEGLEKILTSIKDKLSSFVSEGGNIQNANGVKYNIDSQIERIKAFPTVMEGFLVRQASGQGNSDDITQQLAEGLQQKGDAFIQIGLRDNGEIGPDARQTISFVLYSPDSELLKTANLKELVTLDPFISEKEFQGGSINRSGIVLKRALPWLRDKFLDAEGCRTLHYFMAHRNLIRFSDSLGKDLRMNEWIKFLQSYTVPPLMIKLSKERSQDPEAIDCKKLIEDLLKAGTIVREEDKVLRELVENNCGKEYLEAVLKDTSSLDPEASRKSIHMKQLLSANMKAYGDAFGLELLGTLYKQFLHKLDPQGLIALLLACLQEKVGVPFTAEALCEVAIQKLIESVGVENTKRWLIDLWPEVFLPLFPEARDAVIAERLGADEYVSGNVWESSLQGVDATEEFEEDFGDIVNQERFEHAPIAAAMTLAPTFVDDPRTYDVVAKLERAGHKIPLVQNTAAAPGLTLEHIAGQKALYLGKGFSTLEADAALVRDGILIVDPSFISAKLNPIAVDPLAIADDMADALTGLGQPLSNLPPAPGDVSHKSWGPFGNVPGKMAATADAAEQAKEFISYIKQVVNLQELCEKIVGPLLQAPGLLFSDPDDFTRNWENWADGLKDSLVRHFKPPDMNIPTLRMPDNLSTDDLVGQYATMLLQVLAGMIGMILGEILNLILTELIERCWEDPGPEEAKDLNSPSPTSQSIPLPTINQASADSSPGATIPDKAAWLRDITNFLGNDPLCALLLGEASSATVKIVLDRTKSQWPDVWAAGMDNEADVRTEFQELGARIEQQGGLEICYAIQATTPILVSACEAEYDYDARCAELQLQGLTKEECDEQINQEIKDLKNKIMDLSSMLFPDQNILQGALPEPCGPNGYFVLPAVFENTMSRVTDNFLQAVKTSLIGDMSSLRFFSMPPRALEARSNPEELAKTYALATAATQDGAHELECVMPICHNPVEIFADALEQSESWQTACASSPQALANDLGILPIVYSTRGYRRLTSLSHGYSDSGHAWVDTDVHISPLGKQIRAIINSLHAGADSSAKIIGYSAASVLLDPTKPYNAFPDYKDLPDNMNKTLLTGSAFKIDKPKVLHSVGDMFTDSAFKRKLWGYGPSLKVVGQKWSPAVYSDPAWDQPQDFVGDLPWILKKRFSPKRYFEVKSMFSNWASNLPGEEVGSFEQDIRDDMFVAADAEDPNLWELGYTLAGTGIFRKAAEKFGSYAASQIFETDSLGKAPASAHKYVITAVEYEALRKINSAGTEGSRLSRAFKLTDTLKNILPHGATESPGKLSQEALATKHKQKMDALASAIENETWDGANPSTAFLGEGVALSHGNRFDRAFAVYALYDILAGYLGVDPAILTLNPSPFELGFSDGTQDWFTVITCSSLKADVEAAIDNPSTYAATSLKQWFFSGITQPPAVYEALEKILEYAPSGDSYFVDAFLNMPIGEAIGITKNNIKKLVPNWLGLYDAIAEGGVYFDLVKPENALNAAVFGQFHNDGYTSDVQFETLARRHYFLGDLQLRPVAIKIKQFFRDTENAFEALTPEEFIPSLSSRPTSPKLIKAFDNPASLPTFPKALYEDLSIWTSQQEALTNQNTYARTLDGMTAKTNEIPGAIDEGLKAGTLGGSVYDHPWTNINADVAYFPMPFKNPLAGPRAAAANERLLQMLGSMGFDALGAEAITVQDQINVANLDNTLGYMEYSQLPLYKSFKKSFFVPGTLQKEVDYSAGSGQQIKDDYKIFKGRLLTWKSQYLKNIGGTGIMLGTDPNFHDPLRPLSDKEITKAEYNFEFVEKFDDDVYNILNNIGFDDLAKVSQYSDDLNKVSPREPENGGFSPSKTVSGYAQNMRSVNHNNTRSLIFSKFMYSKLTDLINKYAKKQLIWDKAGRNLAYTFATYGFASCKFAYTNKIFGKLRKSRLNDRKYMKKLWAKVLKSPMSSPVENPQCKDFVNQLTVNTQTDLEKTETDFFDVESIKPKVMEFYKKSICHDVYHGAGDGYTASQKALIEASIILLVRVYCLEMALAGLISWDAYDLGDVFSEPIIKRIVIKNMLQEINNFDLIVEFANSYMKKEENIKSSAAQVMNTNFGGVEYLIERESENINKIIKSIFNNSNQISSKMYLHSVYSGDESLKKELFPILSAGDRAGFGSYDEVDPIQLPPGQGLDDVNWQGLEREQNIRTAEKIGTEVNTLTTTHGARSSYPVINYINNNIYTHNYSRGELANRYYYNKRFLSDLAIPFNAGVMEVGVSDDTIVCSPSADTGKQDFSGFSSRLSQNNFFHSVPLTYSDTSVVNDGDAEDILSEQVMSQLDKYNIHAGGKLEDGDTDAFHDYVRHYVNMKATNKLLGDDHIRGDTYEPVLRSLIWVEEKLKRKLATKFFCDPAQMINQHEYLVGNLINSHMNNFIIQPYVRITDQTNRSQFKSRSSLGDSVEPCAIDDDTQGSIVEADTLLGPDPILANERQENNPFKAWIFDTVPLSVFSWLMTDLFTPWINKPGNEGIKLLYNDHGLKPFFEEVKFGMRLVYVSQYDSLYRTGMTSYDYRIAGILKDCFGVDGLKTAKSGLVSRTYSIQKAPRADSPSNTSWKFTRKDGKKASPDDKIKATDTFAVPLLFDELHIPVVEIEKDISISKGVVTVNGISSDFDDFCYTSKKFAFLESFSNASGDPFDAWKNINNLKLTDFFKPEYKEMYKSLVQTPSNFYFKHVASTLLDELQESAEFKLLFNHIFPIKRYMALGFLYSSDAMLEFIGEPTDVLDETKHTILTLIDSLLAAAEDYTFIPPAVKNQLVNDITDGLRGTNINEPNMTKKIIEIIIKCMLLILKGFVEITDPAVQIAQTILNVAKMVYDTIIMAIEMGHQASKQILQQTIDIARGAVMQLEINLAMAGPITQMSYDSLAKAASQPGVDVILNPDPVKEFNVSADEVSAWSIDIDQAYVPPEELSETWAAFKEGALALKDSLTTLEATKGELDAAQTEMDTDMATFERKFRKTKEEMDLIFGSPFLLPGTWAALLPSMVPYMGGIIPPPFAVGPPSTIPGMIYLVLMMLDMYEEKEAEDANNSKDPNCEDEL